MSKIKILIVDDHELVRSGIAGQLQNIKDFEVVPKQGADGLEVIALAKVFLRCLFIACLKKLV